MTRASRGQGIPINVTLDPALTADKVVLSFRGAGSADFTTRDMREATPGNFIAEIPAAATAGNQVAYFIEAQKGGTVGRDARHQGEPDGHVAGRRPRRSPARSSARANKPPTPPPSSGGEEPSRFFLGLGVGSGVGWATGSGEISSSHVASPAGVRAAQIVHLAPELGYFLSPDLLLSVQARIQFLSGLTAACAGCASPPSTAIAAFAKLTWLFGSDKLRPYRVGERRRRAHSPRRRFLAGSSSAARRATAAASTASPRARCCSGPARGSSTACRPTSVSWPA